MKAHSRYDVYNVVHVNMNMNEENVANNESVNLSAIKKNKIISFEEK